ncbi:DUF1490 family protein [Nocardioides zeae]|uniref:DUF1490 family protein n=1 Tax=Nocardioides imazamoxiresistens TaxID=3231893 RepID=A0ABU3PZ93_9ACTN|nr:DUF1490 family protein [Nocardioides zeae]MDT9594439.1 DUF1490 family protein [Nocardioides zeae]
MFALLGKVGSTLVTGLVGAAAWDGVKKAADSGAVREGAVGTVALGLRGKRRLEAGAERVRLATGDIVAEARERVGEQVPPPGADLGGHDHEH